MAGPTLTLLNALNLGLGFSGLSVNVVRIIVKASVSSNTTSALIFFGMTGAFMMLCTYLAWRFIDLYEKDIKSRSISNSFADSEYNKLETTDDQIEREREQTRFEKAIAVYKCNWKEAVGVFVTTTVQMSFFPGVMLSPDY